MANKRWNHQTTEQFVDDDKGKDDETGNEYGTPMKLEWDKHTDVMPGLPGPKTNPFPKSFDMADDVGIYPIHDGLD